MGTGSSNSMNHKLLEINMLEQVVVGPVNPGDLISHEQILARKITNRQYAGRV